MFKLPRTLDTFLALQEAMDLAQNTGFFEHATTSSGVYPPVNIFNNNGDLVLVAELPGVKKEDLHIEVKANTLRLTGKRTIDYGKDISYHRVERTAYKFDRTMELPINVEPDKVAAEYKDGLLVIFLNRAESDKPKQITIQ
ncbi:MAG: Hsp20/alpha crystallin family protein [Planctomycetes bacterium]|nr:Hsp20/alpha crystallin family protein [Planctomycetota bacterium]